MHFKKTADLLKHGVNENKYLKLYQQISLYLSNIADSRENIQISVNIYNLLLQNSKQGLASNIVASCIFLSPIKILIPVHSSCKIFDL